MMTELSLNILDVANNSIDAGATYIEICVKISTKTNTLTILIKDNGCGMTTERLAQVEDPFFTTRTTRKIGLGIPFFRYSALSTGGTFHIESAVGKGTLITATYGLSHVDRMPLGDMTSTIHTLILLNTDIDFSYYYECNDHSFSLDTREFRNIIGDVPLSNREVSSFIKSYLEENKRDVDNDSFW